MNNPFPKLNLTPLLPTISPDVVKTLVWVFGALALIFFLPLGVEWLWNNFFGALGLPRFHYLNAVALIFWVGMFYLGALGLKEVKG